MRALKSDLYELTARFARALPDLRGKGRIAQWLGDRGVAGTWDIPMRGGYRMLVPRSSHQTWLSAFTGTYDEDCFQIALEFIEPGSIVVDVGASLGFWTVQLAARSNAALILAFEPVEANRRIIACNLAVNELASRARVEHYGLGAARRHFPAYIEKGGVGNAGVGYVVGFDCTTIEVRPLDSVKFAGKCSFVKMDVEGYEMDVLAGGETFVAKHRPVIFGEFSMHNWPERCIPPDAVERWAETHDYGVTEIQRQRPRWFAPSRSTAEARDEGERRSDGYVLLRPLRRCDEHRREESVIASSAS